MYGHPLAGLFWEMHFEETLLELGWEKVPKWECLFVLRKRGLFLSVDVDDIRMSGKRQNMVPMCKKLMKNVDLDEHTSFLDHLNLGCTQREWKPNETIIELCTKMFESRGATDNSWRGKNLTHKQ